MTLAPIGIGTYNRLEHLQKVVNALTLNKLADESELFIFIDGPKKGDEEIVARVNEYCQTINGFKTVNVIQREQNIYPNNNYNGFQELIDKYGKVIWMEDDIVTAPGFLTFMNEALEFYEDNEDIISIGGYKFPFNINSDYKKDYIAMPRFNGWGMGAWKSKWDLDKYDLNNMNLDDFRSELKRKSGKGWNIVLLNERKIIDALDSRIAVYMLLNNKYSIVPKISLSKNIGNDGSGANSIATNRFDVDLWNKEDNFIFDPYPVLDQDIVDSYNEFNKENIVDLLIRILIKINLYKTARKIISIFK